MGFLGMLFVGFILVLVFGAIVAVAQFVAAFVSTAFAVAKKDEKPIDFDPMHITNGMERTAAFAVKAYLDGELASVTEPCPSKRYPRAVCVPEVPESVAVCPECGGKLHLTVFEPNNPSIARVFCENKKCWFGDSAWLKANLYLAKLERDRKGALEEQGQEQEQEQ